MGASRAFGALPTALEQRRDARRVPSVIVDERRRSPPARREIRARRWANHVAKNGELDYHGAMNAPHEAWLFDLDGTLYRSGPVKRMMTLELLVSGWFAIQTLRRFRHEHEVLRDTLLEPVDDPFRLQLHNTATAMGRPAQSVSSTVQEWMFERPLKWIERSTRHELVRDAAAFKAGGGRLAVVSDYPATKKLQAIAAMPEVDVVVASGEPGGPPRLKPHPDGYLEAARRLGVAPERCLVLGDRDDADGEAARRAGMAFSLVS